MKVLGSEYTNSNASCVITDRDMIIQENYDVFWSHEFDDKCVMGDFPRCNGGFGDSTVKKTSLQFDIDVSTYSKLQQVCMKKKININDSILSGLLYLIYKFSGHKHFAIGIDSSQNNSLGIVPFKTQICGEATLYDLISTVAKKKEEIRKYEASEEEINKYIELKGINKKINLNVVCIPKSIQKYDDSMYDFALIYDASDKNFSSRLVFDSNYFQEEFVEIIAKSLDKYLLRVVEDTDVKLKDLEVVQDDEKILVLDTFNETKSKESSMLSIPEAFEFQVKNFSDRTAFESNIDSLSYRQLNERSNQFARYLQYNNIVKGDIVAIVLPRTSDFIISVLGVLKAGGICLPVNLSCPQERKMYILRDSRAKAVISNEENNPYNITMLSTSFDIMRSFSYSNLNLSINALSSAYIIYTSGSTGDPKGVVLHHKGILNHANTKIKELNLDEFDKVSHNLSMTFVASIWLMISPLLVGGSMYFYPESTIRNCYKLFKKISVDNVTIVEIVPSVLKNYMSIIKKNNNLVELSSVRKIILTGEKVTRSLVNEFNKYYCIPLINAYGQSECSDDTLHYHIPRVYSTASVPIGKPSENTRVYILDKFRKLQPIGVPGDLYISGTGLAVGYINNPDLTQEKFIDNPYELETLMYMTGDICKWNQDGTLEYIGRTDELVKINGYRIEIGEIENVLLQYEKITNGVVVVEETLDESNILCCYFESETNASSDDVRAYLSRKLPSYMIPTFVVDIDHIPSNTNGKVDRNFLSTYRKESRLNKEKDEQCNEVEKVVKLMFHEVLEINTLSTSDNYLTYGMDSLNAVIIISEIASKFNVEVSVMDLLKCKTISNVCKLIKEDKTNQMPELNEVIHVKSTNITEIQKMFYVLWQENKNNISLNMPFTLTLKFKLNFDKLKNAVTELVKRHAILRTTFFSRGNRVKQVVHAEPIINIEKVLGSVASEDYLKSLIKPFDLMSLPLFNVYLIQGQQDVIFVDIHHTIFDTFSINVFVKDLFALYFGEVLQPLDIQYKDYVVWQKKISCLDVHNEHESFWINMFMDDFKSNDYPKLSQSVSKSKEKAAANDSKLEIHADKIFSDNVINFCSEHAVTPYIFLFAVFNVLIAKQNNADDLVIGTFTSGRTHSKLRSLIGLFANPIAFRSKFSKNKMFSEYLVEVENQILEVNKFQYYPLVCLLNKLKEMHIIGAEKSLFNVMFDYDNYSDLYSFDGGKDISMSYLHEDILASDLLVVGGNHSGNIVFTVKYNTMLLSKRSIYKLIDQYVEMIIKLTKNKDTHICDL